MLDFSNFFGPVEVVVVALVETLLEIAQGAPKPEFEMQTVVFSELFVIIFLSGF